MDNSKESKGPSMQTTDSVLSQALYRSPIGLIRVLAVDAGLTRITVEAGPVAARPSLLTGQMASDVTGRSAFHHLKACLWQLDEYFEGRRQGFDLPLHLEGSAYQIALLRQILEVPYGETRTLREVTTSLDDRPIPRDSERRSVNPLPIVIPCHRISSWGDSTLGYEFPPGGREYLLELERGQATTLRTGTGTPG